tara:strand:+ start:143 stop:2116 length:1974 start_codon:yes stop_codon:yes gene_type:complete
MASQLRVNKSENRSGLGTITYTDTGAIVSGIVTANSFSGDIIGDITGAVTATTGSFSGDVSIAEKIIHTGDTNTFMKFDTDTVTFETAGDQRIRIDSVGDIFIGTTSDIAPANGTNLCVSDATISRLILEKQSTIKFGLNVSNGFTIYDETNDASRFSIGSDGMTGVRTTVPRATFHVKAHDNNWEGGLLLEDNTGNDGWNIHPESSDASLLIGYNDDTSLALASQAASTVVKLTSTGTVQISDKIEHIGDTNTNIRFPSADTFAVETAGNERLRIDSSGNIGQSVTPSGWASAQAGDFYAYQIGTGMAIFGRGSGDEDRGGISCNYYNTATAQKYIGNGHAGRIYFEDGSIVFSNTGPNANSAGANAALTLLHRMKIDPDGNVMIGRTAGQKPLSVRKVDNSSGVHIVQTIGGNNHVSGYAVGLGFDPEGYEARNKIAIVAEGTGSGYSRGKLHFLLDNNNNGDEVALNDSRMFIDDQGQIGMGTPDNYTDPYRLHLRYRASNHATLVIDSRPDVLTTKHIRFYYALHGSGGGSELGSITSSNAGSVSYNTSSDYRRKQNDVVITDGIAKVKNLRPIRFNWIEQPDITEEGFFAHEAQEVVPSSVFGAKDAVDEDGNPDYQVMDHSKLVPLLTASIKDLIAKVETLEAEVAALKSS